VAVYFEGRNVPSVGVYVRSSELVVGQVYFRVGFLDDEMVVPELAPLVFVGRNLETGDAGLYFQDVESYLLGHRHEGLHLESAVDLGDDVPDPEARAVVEFTVVPDTETVSVCSYEHALDQLLACALRREKWSGEMQPIRPLGTHEQGEQ
jgi:hypothetical protein